MKGYPFWPGKVMDESEAPDTRKKPKSIGVKFFGSGDLYAFIAVEDVRPFFRFQDKFTRASKRRDFLAAVDAVEHYVIINPEVHNFETGDQGGDSVDREKIVSSVDRPVASTAKVGRSESGSPAQTSYLTPPEISPPSARGVKRDASPENGPQGVDAVEPKRRAASPAPARLVHEFRDKKIGFIGLGTIGSRLVRRLVTQGFRVTIYDRSLNEKVHKDLQEFAQIPAAASPAALMQECDIVFDCVYDADAAREVVFGSNGVVDAVGAGKSYVELTTIDPQAAIEMFESISAHGGRFLEAPLSGLKKDAESGSVVFLCAGDKSLFEECSAYFEAMGRRAVFFGDAGTAAKFRLLHQMLAGVMISGVAEIAAVAYKCGLSIYDLRDIIGGFSPMGCALVTQTFKSIMEGVYEPSQQLGQMQRELQLAMNFTGYELAQPALVASAANQAFLYGRRGGEEASDSAALYRILSETVAGAEPTPAMMPPDDEK